MMVQQGSVLEMQTKPLDLWNTTSQNGSHKLFELINVKLPINKRKPDNKKNQFFFLAAETVLSNYLKILNP